MRVSMVGAVVSSWPMLPYVARVLMGPLVVRANGPSGVGKVSAEVASVAGMWRGPFVFVV